jgi:ABC-type Na+ efflux pump permease subunit
MGTAMVRNNLLALLIHTVIGAVLYVFGNLIFQSVNRITAMVALIVFYALYFLFAFLLARFHVFDTSQKKLFHVLLPSVVMFVAVASLYAVQFNSDSALFGVLVGLFGQPVEFIMAVTANRMQRGFSFIGVLLQCATPTPLIWFGLVSGSKNKLDGT